MTPPRWQDVARATGLMGDDGVPRATVFAEMSALAARTGAVNLGQGFPDVDGPASVAQAAADAIAAGANQYPPGPGIPALRSGDRRAPGVALRAALGPRPGGAGHRRRDGGPRGHRARARRPRRRGAHARTLLRLLRGRRRARGRHPHDRAAGRDRRRLPPRPRRPRRRVHPADPAGPGEHPAQPHRDGADPRRARRDRPARRRARRARRHRRGVRAPGARRVGSHPRARSRPCPGWRSGR